MATKKQRSGGTWEYRFTRKGVLDRPIYKTFATETEGDAFSTRVEAVLAQGIVPAELTEGALSTVDELLTLYLASEILAQSSAELIPTLKRAIGGVPLQSINHTWVDQWVSNLIAELSPSTVKKRVELLARAVDWGIRKNLLSFDKNPLRMLAKGYASKGRSRYDDWDGQRDRRLSSDGAEEGAIRKQLLNKEELLLFTMALESAMRLREMYTLTWDQVNFVQSTIFLDRTKNGSKRQIPMTTDLTTALMEHSRSGVDGAVFSWWNGDLSADYLRKLSCKLSHMFAARFEKAGCSDLRFHDLRHEATSRLYERTTFSDLEISKITGHSDMKMLRRYANLRGSVLATRLW